MDSLLFVSVSVFAARYLSCYPFLCLFLSFFRSFLRSFLSFVLSLLSLSFFRSCFRSFRSLFRSFVRSFLCFFVISFSLPLCRSLVPCFLTFVLSFFRSLSHYLVAFCSSTIHCILCYILLMHAVNAFLCCNLCCGRRLGRSSLVTPPTGISSFVFVFALRAVRAGGRTRLVHFHRACVPAAAVACCSCSCTAFARCVAAKKTSLAEGCIKVVFKNVTVKIARIKQRILQSLCKLIRKCSCIDL